MINPDFRYTPEPGARRSFGNREQKLPIYLQMHRMPLCERIYGDCGYQGRKA
jgi:hypothetical protein